MSRRKDDANNRINNWLERFFIYIVTVGVGGMLTFQLKIYNDQQKLITNISAQEIRLSAAESEITLIKAQLAATATKYELLETIKRIELFLNTVQGGKKQAVLSALSTALNLESQFQSSILKAQEKPKGK